MDRADIVHENFLRRVNDGLLPMLTQSMSLAEARLSREDLVALFRAQVLSRHLDLISRKLQARGQGFYTIGSSGHEGNAAVAMALRPTDPAFLHYRDAAFQIARSFQVPGQTPLWDILLSFTSSSEDPISGGRHKVLGSKALCIPPQTSTIASHLPKAVGAAFSVGLAKKTQCKSRIFPDDALILCSFGDASLNHSTAQGAINTASWTSYQSTPLPLLFLCQDNGIGISTKTPPGWVEASMRDRPGLRYQQCNGLDIIATYAAAQQLANWVRRRRRPGFLHMSCIRLYGHAGPDVETVYRTKAEIEAIEANDPLLYTASLLRHEAVCSIDDIIAIYNETGARAMRVAEDAVLRPKLQSAPEIMASIVPPRRIVTQKNTPTLEERDEIIGVTDMLAIAEPQNMARLINFALTDIMIENVDVILAGEDIGRKGGVYGVTQRLQERFGAQRVIDTLLDEQAILGLTIGLAHNGFIPIPEIQFLAYLHNAEDQIRGEASTLSFFSNGQYANPMVVRVAGLGYQRGFGGHFHNDNSIAVLRDIPGLILACPSNGRDAVLMLRESVRLAYEEQRIVVFIEPIALYMTRDLHKTGDRGWSFIYPAAGAAKISLGEIGIEGNGTDLAIVSYANGFYLSCQAKQILAEKYGIHARVIDLRWLAPLPSEAILEATEPCRRILVVDECRMTGSQSEALITLFSERSTIKAARMTAEDCFIATGPAYAATLPSLEGIVSEALRLINMKTNAKAN